MQFSSLARRACLQFPEYFAANEAEAEQGGQKYIFIKVLGSGATGVVLLAQRRSDKTHVAVKLVELSGMKESDRARAITEVHCLLHCTSFIILKCFDDYVYYHPDHCDGKEPAAIALVLDYANAGDLRAEIKGRAKINRPFREHEAGLLFLQCLMAVHHVHNKHMIHRDIKSANVLLCSNGMIKLGDFGFSKMFANTVSDDVGKTFCGTPYYVAPEIWRRCPYSKKADMFSLGVLLYELLMLKRPFDGEAITDVMEQTLKAQYEPLPDSISGEMRDLTYRLLQQDPKLRPSSRQALRLPICKLLLSGLSEVIASHPGMDAATRQLAQQEIVDVKASMSSRRDPASPGQSLGAALSMGSTDISGAISMDETADFSGGDVGIIDITNPQNVICEGYVKKLSSSENSVWKKRYLCIMSNTGHAVPKYALVLAVSKDAVREQHAITPFEELEDAFHVPPKYTPGMSEHVFAVATRVGNRLMFEARSEADRDRWIEHIQRSLFIDTTDE